MHRALAQVTWRTLTSQAFPQGAAQAAPSVSTLVRDVAGELEAIHPHTPRQARIARLEVLEQRFGPPLADRWRALHAASPWQEGAGPEAACAEPRAVSALRTVLCEGPRLLGLYEAHQAGDEVPRMKPEHARALEGESVDTLRWLLAQGRPGMHLAATYGAALDPALRDTFLGQGWRAAEAPGRPRGETLARMMDNRLQGRTFAGLPLAHVLALRLYAHPDSGAFNLVRACADLAPVFPGRAVTACVDDLPALVHEAVHALHAIPEARVWGSLYKGMQSRPGLPLQAGEDFVVDRPLSVTTLEAQSYAGRVVEGACYDQELHLVDQPQRRTQAVLIAAFHPVCTAPQGEALVLPGQVYRILGRQVREERAREGGAHTIVRLRAEKVDALGFTPPGEDGVAAASGQRRVEYLDPMADRGGRPALQMGDAADVG